MLIDNNINCSITKEPLTIFKTLVNQPIFIGTTKQGIEHDKFMDQHWAIGPSGIVQLTKRLDLNELYAEGHNSGLIGLVWKEHHEKFAAFTCKQKFQKVLEIGGGHGALNRIVKRLSPASVSDWTIIEPSNNTNYHQHIKKINAIFDKDTNTGEQYDVIFHSHLFEHLYEPLDILKNMAAHLSIGGEMCFSVPNMKGMVKSGIVSSINFEHTIYLPEQLVESLLEASGFQIQNKEYFKSNHSIFYSCINTGIINDLDYDGYNQNYSDIEGFFESKEKEIKLLNNKVRNSLKPVYVFGAHIFSQFLICNGLNTKQIHGVLDNDQAKQGQRLYGTQLQVFSPEIISEKNAIVILRAGAYDAEIRSQLITLNPNVDII